MIGLFRIQYSSTLILDIDDFDDVPPESSQTVKQILTPSKNSTTIIEGDDFSYTLRGPVRIVELPNDVSKKPKGMKWDDTIRLEFLMLWIKHAQQPFYCWLHNNRDNKKLAEETIELFIR